MCDLAVIVGPYNPENLEGQLIFDEPWVAMIPVTHPLAKEPEDSIALEKLAPYELIIPSRHSRLQEITDWFSMKNVKPKIICRMAHVLNAYELTEQNVGIAIYPAAAAIYADSRKVITKKLIDPSVTASYYLTQRKEKKLSLVAEEFWKYIVQNIEL